MKEVFLIVMVAMHQIGVEDVGGDSPSVTS